MVKPRTDERGQKLTNADLAWFAGFFDGEGCVGAYTRGRSYRASVRVVNTHLPTLEQYSRAFGGRITSLTRSQEHHRAAFVWSVTGDDASAFLEAILPFLREKKEQAALWLSLRLTHPDQQDRRTFLISEIKRLKRLQHEE